MAERVLLVTGGSRGIGAAAARLGGRLGYKVAISYTQDAAAAERVVGEIAAQGGEAFAHRADMGEEADIPALFEAVDQRFGPLTHLVNNVGVTGRAGTLAEVDTATLRRVLEVNLLGAMLVAREAVRRMALSRGGQGGAIVNLSSMAAPLGAGGEFVWYAASKGGIDSFTIGLSREVAKEGIRVNAVAPGLIDTDLQTAGGIPDRLARLVPGVPMARPGTAEEVAEAILWLLSDAAAYVTGTILRVSGGR